jgi:integrase
MAEAEARWEQARWLLRDDSLKPEDRLAGLLVLLYAQRASAISRLTLSHVQAADGQVRIRLGREPVILPEPLGTLATQLAATRRGHAAIGDQGTSPWLLPGGQPSRYGAGPAARSATAAGSSASAPGAARRCG